MNTYVFTISFNQSGAILNPGYGQGRHGNTTDPFGLNLTKSSSPNARPLRFSIVKNCQSRVARIN